MREELGIKYETSKPVDSNPFPNPHARRPAPVVGKPENGRRSPDTTATWALNAVDPATRKGS